MIVPTIRSSRKQALSIILLLFMALALFPSFASADSSTNAPLERRRSWRGVLNARPSNGFTGTWVIGGRTFVATSRTRFSQEHGPLVEGVCVKVKYSSRRGVNQAYKIESDRERGCASGGARPHRNYGKAQARVDSMPANGLRGVWVIGGVSYLANSRTRFNLEHGGLGVGACVEVKYLAGAQPIARKISTERSGKCSGIDASPAEPRVGDSSSDDPISDSSPDHVPGQPDSATGDHQSWNDQSHQESPHSSLPSWDAPSQHDGADQQLHNDSHRTDRTDSHRETKRVRKQQDDSKRQKRDDHSSDHRSDSKPDHADHEGERD